MNPELNKAVCDFLMEHSSKFLTWGDETLRAYVDYYGKCGALGIVREKEKIVAVGMARPIELIQIFKQANDRWHFAHPGDVLFVDEVCVLQAKAIPYLWALMVDAFGMRPFIAAKRRKTLRIWKFEQYQKRMQLFKSLNSPQNVESAG